MSVTEHADTIVQLFAHRVATDRAEPSLLYHDGEQFRPLTWTQLATDVQAFAEALLTDGLQRGDVVAQLSENRREWVVADLAIQAAGAVHVPLHATLGSDEVTRQIQHCGARWLLVSSVEQFAKLADNWGSLPPELHIVLYDAQVAEGHPAANVRSLDDLLGEVHDSNSEAFWREAVASVSSDDLATIIYTSGTTGRPKGVMLTQRNLASNAVATLAAFGFKQADMRLNFLPFSHVFARTCELYTWIASGSRLALAQSRDTLLADAAEVQPTLINGVPYFFSKVCGHLIQSGMQETPGMIAGLFGGRLKMCCSGGAPLGRAEYDLFNVQGVRILEGYGLTETSPVITCNSPDAERAGTVGRAIPGAEVNIADDGEILTRGPHVMRGYLHDDEATAEVIRDGWLHTGDLGKLDDDGYLTVTGRKKELIVTSLGKKVVPTAIEALLVADPAIEQAMVLGEGASSLSALIVPAADQLSQCKADNVVPNNNEALREMIAQVIATRLATAAKEAQVRRFYLCEQPFSVESGELTPSLKLCRPQVLNHRAAAIQSMQTGQSAS